MLAVKLFVEFFKAGLFAVGGGLATLPFLRDISLRTGWFSTADIANMVAISESTPGPLGVNMGTYAGFKTIGLFGGVITTLGLVCPSIVIIIIVSKILERFRNSKNVQNIFYGLRPASTGLITAAFLGVAEIALLKNGGVGFTFSLSSFNWPCIALALVLFFAIRRFKLHPVLAIVIAAAVGIALGL